MKFAHPFVFGVLSLVWLASSAGSVQGSPTTAYTVTDLGVGTTQPTTDASGNGVVITPDGHTSYSFQWTDNHASNTATVLAALPALNNAPVWSPMTYGNPANAYSDFDPQEVFLNRNGVFAGIDLVGVAGHAASAASIAMSAQQQPDGSFGPLTSLFSSPTNNFMSGPHAQILGLNNQDQVLGLNLPTGSSWERDLLVYDLRTGQTTHLNDQVPGWILSPGGAAIDDQGQILLQAESITSPWATHTLLFTPSDLTTDPVAVPEPSTLALFAVGLGAGSVLRRRKHQLPAL